MNKTENNCQKEEEEDSLKNNIDSKDNKEISNLKKSLLLKDQLISKLQRELELNNLKNNLAIEEPVMPNKNKNSNNFFKKYDSYKNIKDIKDTMTSRTNSINKNTIIEDIQKQIFELNIELRTKKNLLSKIKNEKDEIKSNTFTNLNIKQNDTNLEGIIEKNEEKNKKLQKIINNKEKKIIK